MKNIIGYKNANIIRFIFIISGIFLCGLSILFLGTDNNLLFVLGIIIIVIGFVIGCMFYRCPKCGHMLAWRPINIKNCQNCGHKLK